MALALFFIGLILVITGVKGTQGQLASLLASEFTGAGNFWAFIFGIFFLGALGYYPPLRNTSRMLIGLTLLVLILSNGGFWQNLVAAVNNPIRADKAVDPGAPAVKDFGDAAKQIGTDTVKKAVEGLAANNNLNVGGVNVGGMLSGVIGSLF